MDNEEFLEKIDKSSRQEVSRLTPITLEDRFLQYEFETGMPYQTVISVSQGRSIYGISRDFCEWLNNKILIEYQNILNNEEFIKFKNKKIEEEEIQKINNEFNF